VLLGEPLGEVTRYLVLVQLGEHRTTRRAGPRRRPGGLARRLAAGGSLIALAAALAFPAGLGGAALVLDVAQELFEGRSAAPPLRLEPVEPRSRRRPDHHAPPDRT
jgi:hypothetical protein